MAYSKKFRKDFIKVFRATLGNVTGTCRKMGVDVTTYYKWLDKFPEFRAECEQIKEQEVGDYIENALKLRIDAGDTTAIIFALKTRYKSRGYVERQEVTGADGKDVVTRNISKEDAKKLIKEMASEFGWTNG